MLTLFDSITRLGILRLPTRAFSVHATRQKHVGWSSIPRMLVLSLSIAMFGGTLSACSGPSEQRPFVVRVGDEFLFEDDLDRALKDLTSEADRAAARDSYVDQWITTALLAENARGAGIDDDPAIRSLIADNERSVLATAAVERMYAEEVAAPTDDQLRRYYESTKESLAIREDYVQVRYLRSSHPDSATTARRLLQRAMRTGGVDSLWSLIVQRFALDPTQSQALADTHVPERRLFSDLPGVAGALGTLGRGQIASVVEDDSAWHVLQLVDRASEGATPEMSWIRTELGRRLELQLRKEAYARQVQQLRTEAQGRNAIRYGNGESQD